SAPRVVREANSHGNWGQPIPRSQPRLDLALELGREQRLALELGVALDVDEELAPQQLRELAAVHLRHEYALVAVQDLAEVGRERVQVVQVGGRDGVAVRADAAGGGANRTETRAPAEHQDLGAFVLVDLQWR